MIYTIKQINEEGYESDSRWINVDDLEEELNSWLDDVENCMTNSEDMGYHKAISNLKEWLIQEVEESKQSLDTKTEKRHLNK